MNIKMKKTAEKIIIDCLGAKSNESALIITDSGADKEISNALFSSAAECCHEAIMMTIKPRDENGQEPPIIVAEAMKHADIIIAQTSKSLTHTKARVEACRCGSRVVSMPGVTREMMLKGGLDADYYSIQDYALKLYDKLKNVKKISLMSDAGTNVEFDVQGCTWVLDTGICRLPGDMSNLPAGEIFVPPNDANGIVVIDGSMAGIGILDEPIEIKVKNGNAVGFTGKYAKKLEDLVDSVGPKGRNIAELGIGLNQTAILRGIVLEDEKVANTVHVALGSNASFGGNIDVQLHLDGVINEPTIYIDGTLLQQTVQ
ncbi:leucyl aminopeptidase (aminopeptidase T) [Methanosalsum natronophilum]|nr:leucyl aminopeptidase (aminopeptidase T) [Methanosalsum natronophilum]